MIDGLRRGVAAVSWYVGSVMGDHDYRRYVEHRARTHPGEPMLSERDYWRNRYADQDRNPGARCC
ncbi:YbdD/YjiX family protein [Gordonia sp. OPL2]|uniref:YbdD/YjiX family protein n=1 Tax=Gordonia sp. OPL2 TaxID=2486274 RepID=UPI001655C620|nr:YbdD/YjiX family protein [Gordonia sp. OPL2]ROZ93771.1 YbdD/YjiX family protein [Gordonia sp. OPL2]